MEVHSSFLHGESGPTLKSYRTDQKVYVLLVELSHKLFAGHSLLWLERLPAYVLNFVLCEVQSCSNGLVRSIFSRLDGWLRSSEPDQQCNVTEICHLIFVHLLVFHLITIIIIASFQLLLCDHSKRKLIHVFWALASHDQSQEVLEGPAPSCLPFILFMITIDQTAFDNISALNLILVSKLVVSSSVIRKHFFKGIFCTAFSLC